MIITEERGPQLQCELELPSLCLSSLRFQQVQLYVLWTAAGVSAETFLRLLQSERIRSTMGGLVWVQLLGCMPLLDR